MKTVFSILSVVAASAVQSAAYAHDSLAPHNHPHGVSMLPELHTLIAAAIAIAVVAFVYVKFGRNQ